MRTLTIAVPFVLAVLPLPAQSLLRSHSLPPGLSCTGLWPAGDMNGDGVRDFVVSTREPVPTLLVSVVLVSGATGAPLHTLPDPLLQEVREAVGVGDVDGDHRSDVLLVTPSLLRVYSGASGAILAALPLAANLRADCGCGVGDYNGDGTADVAVGLFDFNSSGVALHVLRGENLAGITSVTTTMNSPEMTLRAVGDLSGDGKSELACCGGYEGPQVLNAANGALLWSLHPGGYDAGRRIDALDLDGDGKREVFFFRPGPYGPGLAGTLSVHDAVTGAQRFARSNSASSYSRTIAGVGDLNHDGTQDFAQSVLDVASNTSTLMVSSGADGRRMWLLPNWLPGQPTAEAVAALGDVDGDTYGDFAVQRSGAVSQGWHTISGRILAESQPQTGACGAGPFFPRLGATRPILGQTLTIAGQDAPATAGGVLVLSLQPPGPTWLGASSCTAFFDLGAGIALAPLTTPSWTVALPLPLVPQLAGFEIALQAFWSPTAGPLGYDLSNGVWARLGYQ